MKQNIYDNPGFFKGYQRMRDNQAGLNEVVEQLAMLNLLPELKGLTVLDLGCGTGELCRRLHALGARKVVGVDISMNMLELARKEIPAGITFEKQAMEDLDYSAATFDVITSSLAFHYIEDFSKLINNIYRWLKNPGVLLFSMEHPILTSSQGIHHGWIKGPSGEKLCWPVDGYSQEGLRESHWFVKGVIKYHRTFSTVINSLINAGFILASVSEPVASEEDERNWPELRETRRRPPFLIVKALKK